MTKGNQDRHLADINDHAAQGMLAEVVLVGEGNVSWLCPCPDGKAERLKCVLSAQAIGVRFAGSLVIGPGLM